MTADWIAVFLNDEADVFLEARTAQDLTRNKLVSVFMRILEYYRGVIFLTTNRVGVLDQAFESRIYLKIRYKALDAIARKSVWSNFVDGNQRSNDTSDEQLGAHAEEPLNARQIKNAVKTAKLLAKTDDLLVV